ncbi:hypothetical protein [Bacillus smithii]|uniref:hypothetical protein n=1 Tax=Bacillus smithii TaxID=1479 RepID=UPI0022E658A2|nr:hypothetical protein [Bacillus smithii]
MAPEAKLVKDISWETDQKHYVIRNVPFKVYKGYSADVVYSSDITLKLLTLKDLMESGEIPSDIDFRKAMKIQ